MHTYLAITSPLLIHSLMACFDAGSAVGCLPFWEVVPYPAISTDIPVF